MKIADFGLSTQFAPMEFGGSGLSEKCGTVIYMAPEFTTLD